MNVMTFLIISLAVHAIPLPYEPRMLRFNRLIKWLPFRLVWGCIAWVVICLAAAMTLPWGVIALITSFGLLLMISSGFRPGEIEDMIEGLRVPFTCIGFLIILIVPAFSGVIGWTSDVSNAQYFDGMITESDDLLFNNPIPDAMVRLVTEEYATYVAYQHIGPFGSNVGVAAAHITTRLGRLVWVCTIVSTNVLAENFIKGFIVVDANDPQSISPTIINNTTIPVGEGLFWDKDIHFVNYLNDMTASYEYAYPTWAPNGDMVYVQTRTPIGFDFVERAIGPIVYFENGTTIEYASIADTPEWITQAYSEEWLERQVSRWGSYRRESGFDLFAGGFLWTIPPSRDRLEITEDTRYIVNPETERVEAFIAVHPVTNSRSLAGVFRATADTIYYHDLSNEGFISGDVAAANVVSGIPDPAAGYYFGAMPLLYPVEINSTFTKWTWYCPIYWAEGTYDDDTGDFYILNMRLHSLALVDASNVDRFVRVDLGGTLSGEALVSDVKSKYIELFGGTAEVVVPEVDTYNMTANIVNITTYVDNGETHIVIGTDNSTHWYIEGTKDWMAIADWYALLNAGVSDNFTARIHVVNGVYRIIAYTKN